MKSIALIESSTYRRNLVRAMAVVAAMALSATTCLAQNQSVLVSAHVNLSCDIGGSANGVLPAGKVDFGQVVYFPGERLGVTGTMPIQCNSVSATPYVSFDYGQNAAGSQRRMIGPSGFLVPYDLRMGSASAALWDDQPHAVTIASTGILQVPVYAIVPSMPVGTPDGTFTDVVRVQIYY